MNMHKRHRRLLSTTLFCFENGDFLNQSNILKRFRNMSFRSQRFGFRNYHKITQKCAIVKTNAKRFAERLAWFNSAVPKPL